MNHDRMVNAPSEAVAKATMRLIDVLQHEPADIQSVVACILFKTVCDVHGVEPQDAFTVAGNMLADTIHGQRPEFAALRQYAKYELKK